MSEIKTEAEVVKEVAQEAAEPTELYADKLYSVVVDGDVEILDLERYGDRPKRKRGNFVVTDADAFAGYFAKHVTGDETEFFKDQSSLSAVAVFDGHGEDAFAPGFGDHRLVLQLKPTDAWRAWTSSSNNGQIGSQSKFAEFIEDHIDDIFEPAGATMLELAQSFQANTKVEFKSGQRISNGETRLVYNETLEAKAGQRGDIVIPNIFKIGIKPFEGADTYAVTARLRYRVRDGGLSIGYVLNDPDEVIKTAFNDVITAIEGEIGTKAWAGVPASNRL